jgi:hypothetical protein
MAMGNEESKPKADAELDKPSDQDPNLTVREFEKLREDLKRMWSPLHEQETRGVPNADAPKGNPPANASRPKGNPPGNNDSDTPDELDTSKDEPKADEAE